MPHKYSGPPKVDTTVFEAFASQVMSRIDEIQSAVHDLSTRVEDLGAKVSSCIVVPHICNSIEERVSNLEHIYILVDFLKLENAADHILQNCDNLAGSPAVEAGDHNDYTCGSGENRQPSPEQYWNSAGDIDVACMLAGMAADTDSGQCLIQHARAENSWGNTVAYEFFEGSSLL